MCKCAVKTLDAALPEGANLQARLDMLDQRLSCKDIDGNVCALSRNVAPGLDSSPAEICLEQLDVELPMASGGNGVFDAVGWVLSHPQRVVHSSWNP